MSTDTKEVTFRDRKDYEFDVTRERLRLSSGTDTNLDAIVNAETGEFISAVSPKYKITTHKAANEIAESILGQAQVDYEEGHVAIDKGGARFFRELRIPSMKFNQGSIDSTALDSGKELDELIPTIIIKNSYDRSSSLEFRFGAYRMVCSNGMVSPVQEIGRFNYRHTAQPDTYKISQLLKEQLDKNIYGFKALYERLNGEAAQPYLKALLAKHVINAKVGKILQDEFAGLIEVNFNEQGQIEHARASKELSAYALMNVMTEVATHRARKYTRSLGMQEKIADVFQIDNVA